MKSRIMIVDDEESIRKLLKSRLEREGYEVTVASNAEEAEKHFGNGNGYGTIVTDLKMPGKDGFGLMKSLRDKNAYAKFVVITGHGEKEAAVQAVKSGASDYLEKPFDLEEFTHTVKRCQKEYALQIENQDLIGRLEARIERVEGKTGQNTWYNSQSPAMTKVTEWMNVLKRESTGSANAEEPTVLVLGESGTGKEGIARQVHQYSRRSKGPWVAVNCANFNEQLLESELFGHEKGAFTGANTMKRGLFEIAKGGTLFLDELGEMDVKLQAKLLRVLQEKNFRRVGGTIDIDADVRVVAATNVNLGAKVKDGSFREDLYHRISRVVVEVPALRDRKEDLIPMAKYFANRAFQARGKAFPGFTPEAETSVSTYSWPGNVREMQNVAERVALIYVGNAPISAQNLGLPSKGATVLKPQFGVVQGGGTTPTGGGGGGGGGLPIPTNMPEAGQNADAGSYMDLKKKWVDSFEREYLTNTLNRHHGNVSAAARESKLDRSNFLRLLRRHGIKAQEFRQVGDTQEVAKAA